jgi:hypothetical protein
MVIVTIEYILYDDLVTAVGNTPAACHDQACGYAATRALDLTRFPKSDYS